VQPVVTDPPRSGASVTGGSSRAAAGLFLAHAAIAVATLPASIIIARALGPSGLGEFQLLNRLAMIAVSVAQMGYPHALAWAVANTNDAESRQQVFRTGVRVAVYQGIVVLVLGIGAEMSGVAPGTTIAWICISIYPLLNMVTANIANAYRGELAIAPIAIIRVSQASLWLALIAGCAVLGTLSSTLAVIALVAAQAAAAMLAVAVSMKRRLLQGGIRDSPRRAEQRRRIFRFGLRVYPGMAIRDWNVYLDQIIVGLVLGVDDLGIYAVAVSLTMALGLLGGPLVNTVQPTIQRAIGRGKEIEEVGVAIALTLIVMAAAGAGLAFAALLVVPAIYGSAFTSAIGLVQLLCLAAVLDNLNSCMHGILLGIGAPGLSSRSVAAGLAVNIVGWLVLLPTMGILGAAVTSVVAYSFVAVLMCTGICRTLKLRPWQLASTVWRGHKEAVSIVGRILRRRRRHGSVRT
jgi:O-antigen/teichoic acid export membrane protein